MNDKPSFVTNKSLRLLLFGGKGGVGKTTTAAATSLYLSELYPDRNLLIASTDPAHSLSDSLECALTDVPVRIYERANLFGMEINVEKTLADFKRRYGESIRKIINRGTYLDEDDISRFLELSFPGLDEVMAIVQIMELLEENRYDLIILDTAATGHTVKLLTLPHLLEKWVAFLDTLMAKHRFLSQIYARKYVRNDADDFINAILNAIGKLRSYLQDENRCQFIPVTNLEPMVLAETRRLLKILSMQKISVQVIVVNRIVTPTLCSCSSVTTQQKEIHNLLDLTELHRIKLILVPYFPFEVRGENTLKVFAESAYERSFGRSIKSYFMKDVAQVTARSNSHRASPTSFWRAVQLAPPAAQTQLILFGGKGGVGKTTIASSFALNLSSLYPQKRILLFSTDPAHSLSDCLGQAVGDKVTAVEGTGNLFAVEIDAEKHFETFKRVYAKEINEIFDGLIHRASVDIEFDRKVMANLLDLVPPGLDQIMSLIEITNYVDRGEYDMYVLDNAPTGHALRFLELPDLMQDWLRVLFEILLKYRDVVRFRQTSELLVDMSRNLKKIKEIFSDSLRCEFIPVSIPTQMALAETQRSISALRRLNMPVKRIIVNMMISQFVECKFCSVVQQQQEFAKGGLSEYKERFPEIEIIPFPRAILEGREDVCRLLEFSGSIAQRQTQSNQRTLNEKFISAS
jgi:arsenite-transporting ATPase